MENWLRAQISVVASPWAGSYRAGLRADELASFRDQLQGLYDDPSAQEASFKSMEPWLRLKVRRTDRLGHIELRGESRVEPFLEGHNVLQFVIEIDQSYLLPALGDLAQLLTAYPVLGSPND